MYYIDKESYYACEDYLLSYKPDGFSSYKTPEDVKKAVEELLESFNQHPDTCLISSGGILLLHVEDDYFELYVSPEYRYREVKSYFKCPLKPKSSFELV